MSAPACLVQLHLSQALTLAAFALTHFSAAFSGFTLSPAIHLATRFWSAFDHLKFRSTLTAGEPLWANFLLNSLLSGYARNAHLYFLVSPPAARVVLAALEPWRQLHLGEVEAAGSGTAGSTSRR